MSLHDAMQRLEEVTVAPSLSIDRAVQRLDAAGTGALLVCEPDGVLMGLLTDGDIRRAMLRGTPFREQVLAIMTRTPAVGSAKITLAEALRLMDEALGFQVDQLPLVDESGRATGLVLRRDVVTRDHIDLSALIMAGGFGKRLLPLTETVPKPMLPVGDRPLLERTIGHLRRTGITRVAISTHHLANSIREFFGDGTAHGVDLRYLHEGAPLGTAGALRDLSDAEGPTLVVNGDILTGVDFEAMLRFHREQRADLTVGMRRCELELPYGLLDCDGPRITSVREKPRQAFWANAGIYIVEAAARQLIPPEGRFDMTDLIEVALNADHPVAGFPIVEYWLDVGQPGDYVRAQADAAAQDAEQ